MVRVNCRPEGQLHPGGRGAHSTRRRGRLAQGRLKSAPHWFLQRTAVGGCATRPFSNRNQRNTLFVEWEKPALPIGDVRAASSAASTDLFFPFIREKARE